MSTIITQQSACQHILHAVHYIATYSALSLTVTYCHFLSINVTYCHCHFLSLSLTVTFCHCRLLSLSVTVTYCHFLSLTVTYCSSVNYLDFVFSSTLSCCMMTVAQLVKTLPAFYGLRSTAVFTTAPPPHFVASSVSWIQSTLYSRVFSIPFLLSSNI